MSSPGGHAKNKITVIRMDTSLNFEAVVESMASMVSKHASSIRGLSHENYVMESMLDWNGHATAECENFLTAALNRHAF